MHSCQGLQRANRRTAALLAKASLVGELTLADDLLESVKSSLCWSCKKKKSTNLGREREENQHREERAALLLPEIYTPLYSQLPLIKTEGGEREWMIN